MNISEETFTSWSKGPGTTEAEKCVNAETAVKNAIAASAGLSSRVSVFAQGSYRVRTNVRQDSDVDICARYNDAFFADYPDGKAHADFGNSNSTFTFAEFRTQVAIALTDFFGAAAVTAGTKAFVIHANTYRIDADVIPVFEHRRYTGKLNLDGSHHFLTGVAFLPTTGGLIKNWPAQSYDNGVSKNDATGRHYKRLIRILKRLRNKMQEDNIPEAANIASFLIESLVWNCPNESFAHAAYADDVRDVLAHTFNATIKDEDCDLWGEVNELKYLFRPSQPWTRAQAHSFLNAAWNYIGFE